MWKSTQKTHQKLVHVLILYGIYMRWWNFLRKTYKIRFFIIAHTAHYVLPPQFSIYFITFGWVTSGCRWEELLFQSTTQYRKMLFTWIFPKLGKKFPLNWNHFVYVIWAGWVVSLQVVSFHEHCFWKFVVFSLRTFRSSHDKPLTMNCPAIKLLQKIHALSIPKTFYCKRTTPKMGKT